MEHIYPGWAPYFLHFSHLRLYLIGICRNVLCTYVIMYLTSRTDTGLGHLDVSYNFLMSHVEMSSNETPKSVLYYTRILIREFIVSVVRKMLQDQQSWPTCPRDSKNSRNRTRNGGSKTRNSIKTTPVF